VSLVTRGIGGNSLLVTGGLGFKDLITITPTPKQSVSKKFYMPSGEVEKQTKQSDLLMMLAQSIFQIID
jgi:hypothetical protein